MHGFACIENNGIVVSYRMIDDETQIQAPEVFSEVLPEPPPPSFADYVAQFTPGLQAWMERVAQSNAYDSVLSCVSYHGSGVAQFAGDAEAMIAWRDALWCWASNWQAGFNGKLPTSIPTLQDVIDMAPQPEAFGWLVHTPGVVVASTDAESSDG